MYQGRARAVGDEIDIPDSLVAQMIHSGQVALLPPMPTVVRDPIPNQRDPRAIRRRSA